MAVRFDETAGKRLYRTTDLLSYNSPYTLCAWLYPKSQPPAGTWSTIYNAGGNATNGHIDAFQFHQATGNYEVYVEAVGGNTAADGSTVVMDTWVHVALVRESATSVKSYLNGVLDITNTRDIAGRTASTAIGLGANYYIGSWNEEIDARMALVKAWSAALNQSEIKLEMGGAAPVRLANLYGYWPIIDGLTRATDWSGNGRNWTEGGTLTDEADPTASASLVVQADYLLMPKEILQPSWMHPLRS